MVEHSYLENLPRELRYQRYAQLLDHDIPCVVMCRNFEPNAEVLRIAGERGIPILGTGRGPPLISFPRRFFISAASWLPVFPFTAYW